MKEYVILAVMLVGLPLIYWGLMQWQRPYFEKEETRNRQYLKSIPELLVITVSEVAVIKIWYEHCSKELSGLMFLLLFTVLVAMTVLCMTDLWEKLVPNRILAVLMAIGFIEIGYQATRDMDSVRKMIPAMILGLIFCAVAFGASYIISRGNIGSGDVKLSIILGLLLTGEYVVGTVFYGCLASAIYSLVQLARKKVTRNDELPFVPFLYAGLIFTYFVR